MIRKKDKRCPVCGESLAKTKQELFEKLGLQEDCIVNEKTIKKAFKEKSLEAHPDRGGTNEGFQELVDAKQELTEIFKEELDPLGLKQEEKQEDTTPNRVDFKIVMESLRNLRIAYESSINLACPYCKRKRKQNK